MVSRRLRDMTCSLVALLLIFQTPAAAFEEIVFEDEQNHRTSTDYKATAKKKVAKTKRTAKRKMRKRNAKRNFDRKVILARAVQVKADREDVNARSYRPAADTSDFDEIFSDIYSKDTSSRKHQRKDDDLEVQADEDTHERIQKPRVRKAYAKRSRSKASRRYARKTLKKTHYKHANLANKRLVKKQRRVAKAATAKRNRKVAQKLARQKARQQALLRAAEKRRIAKLSRRDRRAKASPVKSRRNVVVAKSTAKGKSRFSSLIAKHAATYGVPVKLAHAVVRIESNYRPNVRGGAGEVGLMQIKPATARAMGFRGSVRALYNPETNIKYGMKYLAGAYRKARGSLCGTVLRYNAGHYAKRMNPISARYCRKAKRILGKKWSGNL